MLNTRTTPAYVAIAMLLWALVPANPYGYYLLLRVVLCGVGVYLAYQAWVTRQEGLIWLLGGVAALYNPFVPVHLTREIWVVLNLATVALLAFAVMQMQTAKRREVAEGRPS